MDILLAGNNDPPLGRIACRRFCPALLTLRIGFRDHGERHSGRDRKVFGFIPECPFTFIQESRSESSRNPVHLRPGTPFTFGRNTQNSEV
jgi:hypothetical protein